MLRLARPYPDELLSSALVRGCRHFGLKYTQLAALIPGRTGLRPAFFGVSPLTFFEELFDLPAERLLADHTVVPYATAFSEPEVYERAVATAFCGESSGALGAVIQAAIHGQAHRRFCRECVAEDLRLHGESFWHLSHQLPGCVVCHHHGSILQSSEHLIRGPHAGYELPQDLRGRACVATMPEEIWLEVARSAASTARRGLRPPQARTGTFYRDMATTKGWLRGDRDVSGAQLAQAISDRFGRRLLEASGIPVQTQGITWPSLMLQPFPGTPFVTLKHLVLELFLAGRAQDINHTPSGPSAKSRATEDKEYAAAVQRVAATFSASGRRAKVSELLTEAGCWGAYRHRQPGALPRLARVVRSFQTSQKALRPQALQQLAVPGSKNGETATRHDLIKAGHLLCSKDAAAQLGVHWYQMKRLQREGRILSIQYARRDWYPAFWCDGRVDPQVLEVANSSLVNLSVEDRWKSLCALVYETVTASGEVSLSKRRCSSTTSSPTR